MQKKKHQTNKNKTPPKNQTNKLVTVYTYKYPEFLVGSIGRCIHHYSLTLTNKCTIWDS